MSNRANQTQPTNAVLNEFDNRLDDRKYVHFIQKLISKSALQRFAASIRHEGNPDAVKRSVELTVRCLEVASKTPTSEGAKSPSVDKDKTNDYFTRAFFRRF